MTDIMITGSSGFIGRHLMESLLRDGHYAFGFDVAQDIYENVLNLEELEDFIEDQDPDVVVHLAGQTSPWEGEKDPYHDAEVNILGTLNVLLSCTKHRKKFVFASTGAVYGGALVGKVYEYLSCFPSSHYGVSKYAAEQYIHLYGRQHKLKATILRFSSVYGPGGKSPVNIFCEKAVKQEPVIIYGDGTVTRDYTHVDDVVQGLKLAIWNKLPAGNVFNIASGIETSLKRLIELINQHVEKITVKYEPPRPGDIPRNYFDIRRARSYGYDPKITLDEGVRRTIDEYKELQHR